MDEKELKGKGLAELVEEMIRIVSNNPHVLTSSAETPDRELYLIYKREINRREKERYSAGQYSDALFKPRN